MKRSSFNLILCFCILMIAGLVASSCTPFTGGVKKKTVAGSSDSGKSDKVKITKGVEGELGRAVLIRNSGIREIDPPAILKDANRLANEGEFLAAYKRYAEFVGNNLVDNPNVLDAAFKAGVSLFELKQYRNAADYFLKLAEIDPGSALSMKSIINLAISHYYLNEHKKTVDMFNIATQKDISISDKAYISYYRGLIYEYEKEYYKASIEYITADILSIDEVLLRHARENLMRLYKNNLTTDQLTEITESYKGKWGAQKAFEELFVIYEKSGDVDKLEETKKLYFSQFDANKYKVEGQSCDEYIDTARTKSPKVGLIVPITGSGSQIAKDIINGAQLAADGYRDLIIDRDIKIVIKDSRGSPEIAREVAIDLANDENLIAIVGPTYSEEVSSIFTVSRDYCVPFISPSATQEGLASVSSRIFRNSVTDSLEAEALADLGYTEMHLRRYAIIYDSGSTFSRLAAYFRAAVESQGGTVVAVEPYLSSQNDFSGQIRAVGGMLDRDIRDLILEVAESMNVVSDADRKLEPSREESNRIVASINDKLHDKYEGSLSVPYIEDYDKLPLTKTNFRAKLKMNYDAIFVVGNYDKTALILPQIEFYNIDGVAKFLSRSANNERFLEIAGRYSNGSIFVDSFFKNSMRLATSDFVRKYKINFNSVASRLAAQSYDTMGMVLDGLRSGVDSRYSMQEFLSNLINYNGATGMTSISPTGDARKSLFYLNVIKGRIVEFNPSLPPIINRDKGR